MGASGAGVTRGGDGVRSWKRSDPHHCTDQLLDRWGAQGSITGPHGYPLEVLVSQYDTGYQSLITALV